jgi:predicted dienelactone hydrolase
MRTTELVLLVTFAVLATGSLRAARRRRATRLPIPGRARPRSGGALLALAVGVGVTAVHLLVDGTRWQLVPALTGAGLLTPVLLARASGRRPLLTRTLSVTALLAIASSSLLAWALPVEVLPAPSGPYAVGTTTVVIEDTERRERFGPQPGGPREIVLQVWYPADPSAAQRPAPLVAQAARFAELGAAELGLPRFALGHLSAISGHATAEAPALDAQLPVALISHGWTGFRTIHSDLAEQLASEGWVVAAADHRYGALVTTFPDGRADLYDPAMLPEYGTVPDTEYAARSRALIATFTADLELVVRTLGTEPPPLLGGRLDLERLAFVGHSTGGGAAVTACAREPRCAAVVGFDPWVIPVVAPLIAQGFDAPLLSLRSEDWREVPNEVPLRTLHAAQLERSQASVLVDLEGALHRDFTLIGALSPVAGLLGFAGETPADVTRTATIAWTSRFLAHHVLGAGADPALEPPPARVGTVELTHPTPSAASAPSAAESGSGAS